MLEIIALIFLSRRIADTAEDKGHSRGLFRFLTFLLWIGFEFIGAVFGVIMLGEEGGPGVYFFALIGAGLGYLGIYMLVEFLPDISGKKNHIYIVNGDSVPVYEKTIESSRVIGELKKGQILEIVTTTDYDRFFKVKFSDLENGYVLKSSDLRKE